MSIDINSSYIITKKVDCFLILLSFCESSKMKKESHTQNKQTLMFT